VCISAARKPCARLEGFMSERRLSIGLAVVGVFSASVSVAMDTESIAAQNEITSLVIWARNPTTGKELQGSACCVDPSGYVLTVAHQVQGCTAFRAALRDGSERTLALVAVDEAREVALLKADAPLPRAARIGDARMLRNGSDLVAIAAPLGLQWSVVPGTVSNTSRTYKGQPMVQADIQASPGSSGGPVFNREGELVGLIVSRIEQEEAIKFITPINNAYDILRAHGIAVSADRVAGPEYSGGEIIPASNVTSAERQAVEAYNRGVKAASPGEKVDWYRLAVSDLPKFFEAWFNLGVAYTAVKELSPAADAYLRADAIKPNVVEVQRNLGRVYLHGQRLEDALGVFRRALELAPNDPSSHNDLGYVCLQLKRLTDAEACFLKALALKPDYAAARYNLALTYAADGQKEKAVQQFEQYLQLVPNAGDAAEVRAMIGRLKSR